MSKAVNTLILIFFLIPSFASAQRRMLTDDLGDRFISESPPQRIVSLAPNITEILFSLGLEKNTVGVTRFCDYPSQALKKEKIGGMVDPNLEKILSLEPDLIIAFRGNPLSLIQRMRELQLPVFVLEMGKTLEAVFDIITEIGAVTWTEKEALQLNSCLESRYRTILASLKKVRTSPKVFLSLHGMGLWTCGQGSFLNDLLHKAKGQNIAGDIKKKWLLFNSEQLIDEDPDFIIILSKSQKEFVEAEKWLISNAFFRNIEAVKKKNLFFLDENLASRLGPRIFDALNELARLIHPDLALIK
jgi:iron complex transport system substrate-binding protein